VTLLVSLFRIEGTGWLQREGRGAVGNSSNDEHKHDNVHGVNILAYTEPAFGRAIILHMFILDTNT
jgi:hypothetical protein